MQLFHRLLLIICLGCFFLPTNGMLLPPSKVYHVNIDSISQEDIGRHIIPSLKYDSVHISLNKNTYPFRVIQNYPASLITKLNDSTTINIDVRKLLSSTPDSIRVSVLKQVQHGEQRLSFLDTIAISRKELDGISLVFPPKAQTLKSLYAGYSGNLRDKDDKVEIHHKNYNIIEVGASYTKVFPTLWGYSLYGGNDFVFNSEKFFIGPKIGASIHILMLMAGNEIICYSNLNKTMLAYKPYIALGFGPFRISAAYNFMLFNNDYFKMNHAAFGISIPFMFKE